MRQLREECPDQVLVQLREQAIKLRDLGETALANQVLERMAAIQKRSRDLNSKLRLHLRMEAIERSRSTREEQDRIAHEDRAAAALKQRKALAETELQIARARTKTAVHATKRIELQQKQARQAAKLAESNKLLEEERVAKSAAAGLSSRLAGLPEERKAEVLAAVQRRLRQRAPLPSPLPDLWPQSVKSDRLRMISVHRNPAEPRVYASEEFSWELYDGKSPGQVRKEIGAPPTALLTLLNKRCPGFADLFRYRMSAMDFLSAAGQIADAAFLKAVWAYSAVLRRRNFPEGLFGDTLCRNSPNLRVSRTLNSSARNDSSTGCAKTPASGAVGGAATPKSSSKSASSTGFKSAPVPQAASGSGGGGLSIRPHSATPSAANARASGAVGSAATPKSSSRSATSTGCKNAPVPEAASGSGGGGSSIRPRSATPSAANAPASGALGSAAAPKSPRMLPSEVKLAAKTHTSQRMLDRWKVDGDVGVL